MTVFTRLSRVSDSSRFERCRVIGAATEAAYRPACCGALAIGIAMASAAAAAAVQVHSNSKQKLLFFLGLGLGDPNHGLFGILPELIRL